MTYFKNILWIRRLCLLQSNLSFKHIETRKTFDFVDTSPAVKLLYELWLRCIHKWLLNGIKQYPVQFLKQFLILEINQVEWLWIFLHLPCTSCCWSSSLLVQPKLSVRRCVDAASWSMNRSWANRRCSSMGIRLNLAELRPSSAPERLNKFSFITIF